MPTRKQRRRREKLHRHEWEEVYVDAATGEEVEVEPEEVSPARERKPRAEPAKAKAAAKQGRGGRSARVVQPPSWEKVLRRGAIFAPFMFLTVYLLAPKDNRPVLSLVFQTLVLLLFFIPFSYFMDRFTYRAYLRRTGGSAPAPRPTKKR